MGVFRMPSLGADMEAGTLVEWLKRPGDPIASGDIIAVVETQKGAIEVEAFESGTVTELLTPVGSTVPVGTALAMIQAAGEPSAPATAPISAPVSPLISPAPIARPAPPSAAPPATPASIGVAAAPGATKAAAAKVSPAARKFAADRGIDLAGIAGSGPDGAIVYVDVETAWQQWQAKPATSPEKPRSTSAASGAALRSAIAAAMGRSKREIPHYYLGHAIDVTDAMAWLTARNAERPAQDRVLFAALLLKAVALSLGSYPEFNGLYRDSRFEPSKGIHVGVAIALRGGGLAAPAIHDTDKLPLDQLMQRLADLTNRLRAGRLRASELADPTITLTSLGERGVDLVQPVIYPPQVAIIGAGAAALRPWISGDRCVPRQICQLSLAADHRVSDGHRGALLLRAIAERLQAPETL